MRVRIFDAYPFGSGGGIEVLIRRDQRNAV
jgi:hypothetical protein